MSTQQIPPTTDTPSVTEEAEPPSTPTAPPLYTPDDRKKDPVFKEFQGLVAEEARKKIKAAEDRMNDIPVVFKIGGKDYKYTSRPLGYMTLVLAEFMSLRTVFTDLQKHMFKSVSPDDLASPIELRSEDEDAKPLVDDDDVNALFMSKGEEGMKVMVNIAQLLVQELDKEAPGPPPVKSEMTLRFADAMWGLSAITFAKMLSEFFARDLMTSGEKLRGAMSLGPGL